MLSLLSPPPALISASLASWRAGHQPNVPAVPSLASGKPGKTEIVRSPASVPQVPAACHSADAPWKRTMVRGPLGARTRTAG